MEKAVDYWLKAGQQAVARSTNVEAIAHFTRGLEVLRAMPDTPERLQQELGFLAALGPALIATRGFAAPAVEQAYSRARDLCLQLGETPQLFPILWGLFAVYLVRADLLATRDTVEQLLQIAQSAQDSAPLLVAHRAMATTFHFRGEFVVAQEHEAQGIALEDPQQYSSLAVIYGEHPGVVCRCFAAHDLWYLGYPERALMSIHDALTLARQLAHPYMVAHAVDFAAWLHLYRREGHLVQEQAVADIALATEHNFAFFLAHGTILRGWALVEQGQKTEGIAQIRQGLAAYRATGAECERSFWLALLAEAYGKVGQPGEGLVVVAEALAEVHKGWRFCEAELFRLKGELLLGLSAENHSEAETCFHQAFKTARNQQAKSLELRISVSLSRLWRDQGKRDEARDLLAPVYGWFTEGFDTRDLKEAKALLDELAA
jgi:predicted ATPase